MFDDPHENMHWQVDCSNPDAGGQWVPMTPEEIAAREATAAAQQAGVQTATFEQSEDAERLAVVNERAQVDPAFAALVELTLGKEG